MKYRAGRLSRAQLLNNSSLRNLFSVSMLASLAACGGGGKTTPPARTPDPAPVEPDFTEEPANVFIARTDNNSTLHEAENSNDLIVIGKAGDDTITTGSGNDFVRGGEGADTVNLGEGNDFYIIIGTTGNDQYAQSAITNSAGADIDLSDVITLGDLNNHENSDAADGEEINGGAGNDGLILYGQVDLSTVTILNFETVFINSQVIFSVDQFAANGGSITSIVGDGSSEVEIVNPDADNVTIDLDDVEIEGVQSLTLGGNVTVSLSAERASTSGLSVISGGNVILEGDVSDYRGLAFTNDTVFTDAEGNQIDAPAGVLIVDADNILESGGVRIVGTDQDQTIYDTIYDDVIELGSGAEDIHLQGGNDQIVITFSNTGTDTIHGYEINDTIRIEGLDGSGLYIDDFLLVDGTLSLRSDALARVQASMDLERFSLDIQGISGDAAIVLIASDTDGFTFRINQPPVLGGDTTAHYRGEPGSALDVALPAISDPDGEEVRIEVTEVSAFVRVETAEGRVLERGDLLTTAEYNGLTFTLSDDHYLGGAGGFSIHVSDAYGGRNDLSLTFASGFTRSESLAFVEVTAFDSTAEFSTPVYDDNQAVNIGAEEVYFNDGPLISDWGYNFVINNEGSLIADTMAYQQYVISLQYANTLINAGEIVNHNSSGISISSLSHFNNSGIISASSSLDVTALSLYTLPENAVNSGTIQAMSESGVAYGIRGSSAYGGFVNSGGVFVSAAQDAFGYSYHRLRNYNDTQVDIENTGSLIVESQYGDAVGILYGIDTGIVMSNSGFISADIAIKADEFTSPQPFGSLDFDNSGEIWGDFELGLGLNTIVNTGLIVGDIYFHDGNDIYNGMDGLFDGVIYAAGGHDSLYGGGLNETFYGGFGDDLLKGGDGNDTLYGEENDDILHGELGNDFISAGSGDDIVYQLEADVIRAGHGDDTIIIGDNGFNSIDGGEGDDTLVIQEGHYFDFSYIGDENIIQNIEVITLEADSGVAINSQFPFEGEKLFIRGEDTSEVYLIGDDWTQGEAVQVNEFTYQTYHSGDKRLYVELSVDVTQAADVPDTYTGQEVFDQNLPVQIPEDYSEVASIDIGEAILWTNLDVDEGVAIEFLSIRAGYSHDLSSERAIVNYGTLQTSNGYGSSISEHYIVNHGLITSNNANFRIYTNYQSLTNELSGEIYVDVENSTTLYQGNELINKGVIDIQASFTARLLEEYYENVRVNNSGDISIFSDTVYAFDVTGNLDFENSGSIVIDSSNESSALYLKAPQYAAYEWTIENSGLIRADNIIQVIETYSYYDAKGTVTLTNSGTLEGNILLHNGDDSITNTGEIAGDIYLGEGNDVYAGHNGTLNGDIFGEEGEDRIIAGDGAQNINGGAGNDTLTGGAGDDIFIFDSNWGQDTITDFEAEDVLDLSSTGLSFSDLTITSDASGTTIEVAGGHTIFLEGYAATVTEADFIF